MKMNLAPRLKPALVIGSGFHRHVFGECPPMSRQCLFDWHALITQTAQAMQVATPPTQQFEVLRWETLITSASTEGYLDYKQQWHEPSNHSASSGSADRQTAQAHKIENVAKRIAADLIGKAGNAYPSSTRAAIPKDPRWGCVISLNCDHAWLPDLKKKHLSHSASYNAAHKSGTTKAEFERMYGSVLTNFDKSPAPGRRVWFPNGCILKPESLRLGLHEYGSAPISIKSAIASLKGWETSLKLPDTKSAESFAVIAQKLIDASEAKVTPSVDSFIDTVPKESKVLPLTWAAEMFYRPLVFAGVGLSQQESGLWWLLVQRARNLARVKGHPDNAAVTILLKRDAESTTQAAFWSSRPMGIKPLFCDGWEEGWQKILDQHEWV